MSPHHPGVDSSAAVDLLKNLRNTPTSNIWSTDISVALQKYVQLVKSQNIVDFIEAGFIVEDCSKIYCKKVMLLYNLVEETASRLNKEGKDKESSSRDNCDSPKKKRKRKSQQSTEDKFESLDNLEAADPHLINCTESNIALICGHRVLPDPPLLSRTDLREKPFTLVDRDGEERANLNAFAMNYCVFHESGALLLPTVPKDIVAAQEDDGPSFLSISNQEIENCLGTSGWENASLDEVKGSAHGLSTESVFQAQNSDEHFSISDSESPPENLLQRNLQNENADDETVNRFLQTTFYESKVLRRRDRPQPLNTAFLGLVDAVGVEKPRGKKKRKAFQRRSQSESNDCPLPSSTEVQSGEWIMPLPDFADSGLSRTYVRSSSICHQQGENDRNTEEDNLEVFRCDDIAHDRNASRELEESGLDHGFFSEETDGDERCNEEPVANVATSVPLLEYLESVESSDQIDGPMEESEEQDVENFEQSLQKQIEKYFEEAALLAPRNELSEKVKEWEDNIRTILKETETREQFDIQEYSEKLMDHLDKKNEVIPFEDVCKGKSQWEICRYFLSSLQMANEYNIEITTSLANLKCPIGLVPLRKKKSKRSLEREHNPSSATKKRRQNSDELQDSATMVDISDDECQIMFSEICSESSWNMDSENESWDSDGEFHLSTACDTTSALNK